MSGRLVYFWIPVPDSERAKALYGGLLGWEFEPGNVPDGFQIKGTDPPGGLHGGEEASHPQICFDVDDIHAGVEKVRELGGDADEPVEIPTGHYARCRDDQGTSFFLWSGAR